MHLPLKQNPVLSEIQFNEQHVIRWPFSSCVFQRC